MQNYQKWEKGIEVYVETVTPLNIGINIARFEEELVADKPDNGSDTKAHAYTVHKYHI